MARMIIIVAVIFFSNPVKAVEYSFSNMPEKIIKITVNKTGIAFIGRDTLFIDQLTDELVKRLWKSYLGTGNMFDEIQLQFSGDPSLEVKKSAVNAIQEAQKKTLIDISLQKYKRLFEDLNSRQQRKIKNHFPVLFQTGYD